MYGIDVYIVYINMQKDQTIELIDGSIKLQYCTPLILGYAWHLSGGILSTKGYFERLEQDKLG